MSAGVCIAHHAQKGFSMYSLHTDPIYDLGTLMCHAIDRLSAEMDGAIAQRAEVVTPEPEEDATFDYYAYACEMLNCW